REPNAMYRTTLLLVAILGCTHAFPSGAHNNASNIMDSLSSHCTSGHFRPNHGQNLPQHTEPPYTITVSSPAGTMYKAGQPVTVTIGGVGAQKFKGFFLFGDCTAMAFAGEIVCEQGHNVTFCGKSGATHSNAVDKSQVVCKWTPPDYQVGRVQFVATVVQKFDTYWTSVKSSTTLDADPTMMTYEQKSAQLRNLMLSQMSNMGQGQAFNMFNSHQPQGQPQGNPFAPFFNQADIRADPCVEGTE
ncbi:defense protein l(2)34Fc, partial [Biomphalaria glabrata]